MKMFHDPPAAGHVGMARMVATMNTAVYWKSLIKDVEQYVRSCTKCQQYKQLATRTPMSAKPVPTKCLEEISMDVVGPLPSSSAGNKYVLVIQDRLSRYISFISMKNQTAETVARYFLVEWVCKFGAPKKLITDRGSNFMSTVFTQLCKFLGTTHSPTCAYRPQGNAQNERSHQQLHAYIAMYTDEASAENWDLLLQYAAWVHNTTVHTALGKSPFEILTGQSPRNISGILKPDEAEQQFDSLQQYLGMKQDQLRKLRLEAAAIIEKAQASAIQQRNKFARVPTYQVGDEVWVKLHATNLINKKWNRKYDGPYVIKEVISPQVVKVFLKSDPAFVDLVHTTRIRRYIPRTLQEFRDANEPFFNNPLTYLPEYSDDESDENEEETVSQENEQSATPPHPSSPSLPSSPISGAPSTPSRMLLSPALSSPTPRTPPGFPRYHDIMANRTPTYPASHPSSSPASPNISPGFWSRFWPTPRSNKSRYSTASSSTRHTPSTSSSALSPASPLSPSYLSPATPPSSDRSFSPPSSTGQRLATPHPPSAQQRVPTWRRYLPFGAGRQPAPTLSPPTPGPISDDSPEQPSSSPADVPSSSRPARSAKALARRNIAKTVTDWDSSSP
jgi:transposase InsO family protein